MPYKNTAEQDEYQRKYRASKGITVIKRVKVTLYYPVHILIYSPPKLKPEILELDQKEISDEQIASISAQHPDAVVVWGARWWMGGLPKRYKEIRRIIWE